MKKFFGKRNKFNIKFEFSEDAVKGRFVYSRPNFAYTDNTLFTSLELPTSSLILDIKFSGASLGTQFEQYENFTVRPEIELFLEDLETNPSASTQLKKQGKI